MSVYLPYHNHLRIAAVIDKVQRGDTDQNSGNPSLVDCLGGDLSWNLLRKPLRLYVQLKIPQRIREVSVLMGFSDFVAEGDDNEAEK